MKLKPFILSMTLLAILSRIGFGYVDSSPTLGSLIYQAGTITLVEVDKVNEEKQVLAFRKVADLKGNLAQERLLQAVKNDRSPQVANAILAWAEPKKTAICFIRGSSCLIYTGGLWYETASAQQGWWLLNRSRPELAFAYIGTVEKLRRAVTEIAAKRQFVITAIRHKSQGSDFYEDAAFQHNFMRGPLPPLWRLKASMDMPGVTISLTDDPKSSSWIVGQGAGSAEDVPPFVALLTAEDARVRADAADELRLLGKEARSAIPALEKALADSEPTVRIRAAAALERIDPANSPALTTLLTMAADPQAPRRRAVEALGDMGTAAKQAVPLLKHLLDDKDAALRASAVESLGLIGADAGDAVPELTHLLDDKDVAAVSADALGRIGARAKTAAPRLIAAIRNGPADLRWVSAVALIHIDPAVAEPAIPVLIEGLKSPDERTRWDARRCFLALGPTQSKAIAPLLELLKSPDDYVQTNAAQVLGTLESQLRDSVPVFIEMVESHNRARRLLGIFLLRSTGPDAQSAVPVLEKAMNDPDREIQSAARLALKAITHSH